MARWLVPLLIIAAGACLFAGGLAYGIAAVGVPTPDASPAVAAREARDSDAAGLLMSAGLVVAAVGVASLAGVTIARAVRRRARDEGSGR